MGRAWLFFLLVIKAALSILGGIILSVRRRLGVPTRRLHSSLRSHRPWRSSCRHAYSGL